MRIAERRSGTACRAVGEIQVRGPNVIEGYWQQPQASAESFTDGGWFRSGGMGYVDTEEAIVPDGPAARCLT